MSGGTGKTKTKMKMKEKEKGEITPMVCVKLIVLGNSQVGKTSMILRYMDDKFTESFTSTLGVDFKRKILTDRPVPVQLQIWDTGGQERFRTITRSYFDKTMGVVLVYDSTNEKSFEEIINWIEQVENHARPDVVKILVAAKCDKPDTKVKAADARALADEYKMAFYETSAKTGTNVAEALNHITDQILQQKGLIADEHKPQAVQLNRSIPKKKKCC